MITAPHRSEIAILLRSFGNALLFLLGLAATLLVASGAGAIMGAIHVVVSVSA